MKPSTLSVTSDPAGKLGLLMFAIVFAAQIALYRESLHVRPAGDDFAPPLAEIVRGEEEGPLAFFLETKQSVYRPLQSLTMWLFGRVSDEHRFFWLSIMRFGAMGLYGLVCWMWTRCLGLGRLGTLVTAIAFFAHPALGGVLGGIDTFAGLFAHAFMWLGALAAVVWRDRFALALSAALFCLVVGSLYKEYAFGLVPLAALTTLVFSPRKRWSRSAIMAGALLAFMLTSLVARRYLGVDVDPRLPSQSLAHMIPNIARNAALLTAATVFTGDTVWVNVQQSAASIFWVAVNATSFLALIAAGVAMKLRSHSRVQEVENQPVSPDVLRRWVVFLLLSFLAASFPANMIPYRVSEVYVSGLFLPLALLCGLAAEGFATSRRWTRWLAIALATGHLAVAATAVTTKVHGLRDSGDNAAKWMDQLASVLPDDARDQNVALVFIKPELASLPHYSVFLMQADDVFQSAEFAIEYRLPGRGLIGELIYVDDIEEIDMSSHHLIVRWDQESQKFVRIK